MPGRFGYDGAVAILTARSRRWLPVALVLLLAAGGGAWYWRAHQPQTEMSERALNDIPKDEYEAWMQSLGYTD